MKKIFVAIPIVIIVVLILFFVFSYANYDSIKTNGPSFLETGAEDPVVGITNGVSYANLHGDAVIFIRLMRSQIIKPSIFNSFYFNDDNLLVVKYYDILVGTKQYNLTFLGDVDEAYDGNILRGGEESSFFKAKINCENDTVFVEALDLNQINCNITFTQTTEKEYAQNKDAAYELIKPEMPIGIVEAVERSNELGKEFNELNFFEYLLNPVGFETKYNNINEELATIINGLNQFSRYELIVPKEELSEILSYMEDKNINFIVESRPFVLAEDEIDLATNYPIILGSSWGKLIQLDGSIIKSASYSSVDLKLKLIVKKQDGNYEISFGRT